jgi:asparagine synthase (glutamine-hydrolysing)
MCGIVGVLARRRADSELVARLAALLRHRGPDDEGLVAIDVDGGRALPLAGADTMAEAIGGEHPYLPRGTDADAGPWDVVLASRRLAIIDLSAAGHQPLCSPDRRAWIVHNGEIYNYVELRRELSALGHRFRGGSDTEVALAAYREWGTDCFERFNGMWGMAIWDGEQRRLVLSRDRFGVKPLYFADADQFVFASELKAILASGAVTPTENEAAVATFLATGRIDVRGGETSFAGVCQVEPGCYVVRSLDGAAAQLRYYDLVARVRPARATELLDLLDDAVALRLRSDVPVGSSLSGGVDSSAVVALAQRRLGPGLPMRTFTFASRAADDETEFAALVARHVGAGNVATEVPDFPLPELLAQVVWEQDEPIGSGSVLAQRQVMARAHEDGLKVLLDGQGGDEVLAGYKYYVATNLADLLARGRLVRWAREVRAGVTNATLGTRWLVRATAGELRARPRAASRLRSKQIEDVFDHLPALLHYEDRNSMAHSIETRLPFLDYRVVEFALGLPNGAKIDAGWTKVALRRAITPLLPPEIVWRREKVQFSAPQRAWLRGPLRELALDSLSSQRAGAAGRQAAAMLLDETAPAGALDHVWRLLAVEVWRDVCVRSSEHRLAGSAVR